MSLDNLTIAELQSILMRETKKYTSCLREGCPQEEKDELRKKIDMILKLLQEKKEKKGFNPLSN